MEHMNPRGKTLAIGFGTTTGMWIICYLAMMNPGMIVGEVLFALILACVFAGGYMAGRNRGGSESGWLAGLKVGLVASLLNLLIVGALLVDPQSHQLQPKALMWIGGNFAASLVLGLIGGLIGDRGTRDPLRRVNWYGRFLIVATVTVFLLLITGGLVTGLKAGLAVPDWPTSFGHNMLLYPLAEMSGGKYFEHAHRLYGMLVGVTAITVAVSLFIFDHRRWMWALGIAYLLTVIAQGVMGGLRVTEINTVLAIVHGMFGQIVLATIACIAAFASTTWKSDQPPIADPGARGLRRLTLTLVIMLIVQLGLGALYRHLRRDGGHSPEPVHPLYTHIFWAVLVVIVATLAGGRAWGRHRDIPVLRKSGAVTMHLTYVQLILGIVAMIVVWMHPGAGNGDSAISEVIFTSIHQAAGALLLTFAALLMVWTRRMLAPASM